MLYIQKKIIQMRIIQYEALPAKEFSHNKSKFLCLYAAETHHVSVLISHGIYRPRLSSFKISLYQEIEG